MKQAIDIRVVSKPNPEPMRSTTAATNRPSDVRRFWWVWGKVILAAALRALGDSILRKR